MKSFLDQDIPIQTNIFHLLQNTKHFPKKMTSDSSHINEQHEMNIIFPVKEPFHDNPFFHLFPEEKEDWLFGLLQIKTPPMNTQHSRKYYLFFSNDCSGSMADRGHDCKKKIEHANQTICNILQLCATMTMESKQKGEQIEFWIEIIGFDDQIHPCISATLISNENVDSLIEKVKKMEPQGMTNIELALKHATKQIQCFQDEHTGSGFEITHLFMTDGSITRGETDIDLLRHEIHSHQMTTVFIGFGLDHSSETLIGLSEEKNSRYYFVDAIDKCGWIYGEIMHDIVFKCYQNIHIEVTGAEIYQFRHGKWSTFLDIDYLPNDVLKTYHLRTLHPNDVEISFSYQLCHEIATTPETTLSSLVSTPTLIKNIMMTSIDNESISMPTSTTSTTSPIYSSKIMYLPELVEDNESLEEKQQCIENKIIPFMFRQKTLELLYQCQHISCEEREEIQDKKQEVRTFMDCLKRYMLEYQQETNEFYTNLYDDLVIALKLMGTEYQNMYITSRERSNGNEFSYKIMNLPPEQLELLSSLDYLAKKGSQIPLSRQRTKSCHYQAYPIAASSPPSSPTEFQLYQQYNSKRTKFPLTQQQQSYSTPEKEDQNHDTEEEEQDEQEQKQEFVLLSKTAITSSNATSNTLKLMRCLSQPSEK